MLFCRALHQNMRRCCVVGWGGGTFPDGSVVQCVCVCVCYRRAKCHVSLDRRFLFSARMSCSRLHPPGYSSISAYFYPRCTYSIYDFVSDPSFHLRYPTRTRTHFLGESRKAVGSSHRWWWEMIQESGKEGSEGLVRGNCVAPDVGNTYTHTQTHRHAQINTHTLNFVKKNHTQIETKTHTAVHVRTSSVL